MTAFDSRVDPAALAEEALRDHIAGELTRARERTQWLTGAVDEADLIGQHSPLMSPLVWDHAHIGNQEELWLLRDVGGRAGVRTDIDQIYDAFANPRADRPSLPLLSPTQARGYALGSSYTFQPPSEYSGARGSATEAGFTKWRTLRRSS